MLQPQLEESVKQNPAQYLPARETARKTKLVNNEKQRKAVIVIRGGRGNLKGKSQRLRDWA